MLTTKRQWARWGRAAIEGPGGCPVHAGPIIRIQTTTRRIEPPTPLVKRTRRKLWTATITAAAALIVLAAVVTGLFRGAVLLVPGYREDLERKVSELAGYPVHIGEMDLRWRGLSPALDLGDIEVLGRDSDDPVLHLRRLVFGTTLWRLLRGERVPRDLRLEGLELGVERGEDGAWTLHGVDRVGGRSRGTGVDELLDTFSRFERVDLVDCLLRLSAPAWFGDSVHRFQLQSARLSLDESSGALQAQLDLPDSLGGGLMLEAQLDGALKQREHWAFDIRIDAERLQLATLLPPWFQPGAALGAEGAELRINGRNDAAGALAQLDASVRAEALRGADETGPLALDDLDAGGSWRRDASGWTFKLDRLDVQGAQGPWPATHGQLQYQAQAGTPEWRADLSYFRVDDWAPALAALQLPPGWAQLPALRGELRALVLHWRQGADRPRYQYLAELTDAGLDDGKHRFVGLSGALSGDENGGRLAARPVAAELAWPDMFADSLTFERLGAELSWTRGVDDWTVTAEDWEWALLGASGRGELSLRFPDEGDPRIELDSQWSSDDVLPLKAAMPLRWRESLRDWLDSAVRAGRVSSGRLKLAAHFAEFGHKRIPAGFALDMQVAGGRLAFQPDWPQAEDLEALVSIHGNGLKVTADRGSLGGVELERLSAAIADFRDRQLHIEGRASGDAGHFYRVIEESPLRERLAGLLDQTDASGLAALDLVLDVSLVKGEPPLASGDIQIEDGEMHVSGLPEPLLGLNGRVHFDENGVSASGLGGRWRDVEFLAALTPQDPKTTELEFRFDLDATSELFDAVPDWVRARIQGPSAWTGRLRIGGDGTPQPIRLRSELADLRLALPAPLALAPGEAGALDIELRHDDAEAALHFHARLADRLQVQGLWPDADPQLPAAAIHPLARLRYLQVWFGAGEPPAPQAGVQVGGAVDAIDVRGWTQIYEPTPSAAAMPDPVVSVGTHTIEYGRFSVQDAIFSATHDAAGWDLALDGERARGTLHYPTDAQGEVHGRFERLDLLSAPSESADFSREREPLDPRQLPTIDLDVSQLHLNDISLGRLQLKTVRMAEGQRIEQFQTSGAVLRAALSGQWTRAGEDSGAELGFDVHSEHIANALKAFGYADNLDARKAEFRGELKWDSAAAGGGLSLAQASGKVGLSADRGRLRTVEPGAGRVLGLVNFYALPRRLALNFSDVVGEGLAFDSINGGFTLGEGFARTDDLEIDAPSVRIEVRGSIGLAQRNYDQRVNVYPDMSGGVTLGAALLGGPAVGVIALLAQELLDKPLDQATQLSYHVGGSWDNPQVTKIENGS